MIEFYSPFGMRHFFYLVLTPTKMKIPTKLSVYIMGAAIFFHKWACERPATDVKTGKATYTFTSVKHLIEYMKVGEY